MQAQRHIFSTLFQPEGLDRLATLMDAESFPQRSALADRVSEDFGFHAPSGTPQRASCLKALRDLDARDLIALPPRRKPGGNGQPRLLGQKIQRPAQLPDHVGQLPGLRAQRVDSDADRRIYHQLLADEHPQGAV